MGTGLIIFIVGIVLLGVIIVAAALGGSGRREDVLMFRDEYEEIDALPR